MIFLHTISGYGMNPAMGILVLLALLVGTAFEIAVLYVIYFLLTLPMRRAERARLFLDVLELGLKEGRTPEAAVIWAASSRDAALGVRFHLVAALIEQGKTLGRALADVPFVLPRSVVSMLSAGERTGNLALVLPACRRLLVDSISQVRGALNYLLLLTFAVTPAVVVLPLALRQKVMPVFSGLFAEIQLPAFSRFVFGVTGSFSTLLAIVVLLLWTLSLAYVGGPRLRSWLGGVAPVAVDRFLFWFPWRRKRLLRDFTAMLALLMDSGVSEAEAVRLAGEATDNIIVKRRAADVLAKLASGIPLAEGISAIDSSGELRWRLRNALRRGNGFVRSLCGWHDLLEARAFQQEQTAAQLLTTFLVLFNGLIIGSVATAFFLVLVNILHEATLW